MYDPEARLARYLELFPVMDKAGADPDGELMAALLDCYSPDVRYRDVPSGYVFEGREAMKHMFIADSRMGNDRKVIVSHQTDGRNFAFETEASGINRTAVGEPGRKFLLLAVSVGCFDDDGRILEQRDYWDPKSFRVQIGAEEPTGAVMAEVFEGVSSVKK